jgi:hypothetical protein
MELTFIITTTGLWSIHRVGHIGLPRMADTERARHRDALQDISLN